MCHMIPSTCQAETRALRVLLMALRMSWHCLKALWRRPTRLVSAALKYKFCPMTEAVMDTQVMLIVAIDTTCKSGKTLTIAPLLLRRTDAQITIESTSPHAPITSLTGTVYA